MAEDATATGPAFRKWTPSVMRGIRYAIASVEFDAAHDPVDPETGKKIETGINNDDLRAAAEWLRYEFKKREGEAGAAPSAARTAEATA